MRTRIWGALAGLLAAAPWAYAQPRPVVTLGRPVVTLGGPVALGTPDSGLTRTAYSAADNQPIVRMAMDPLTGPAAPPPGVAPVVPYAPPLPPAGALPPPPPPGGVLPAPGCGCSPRVWASADYLLWWIKDGPLPGPLVPVGTPPAGINPAALSQLSALAVGGGRTLNYGTLNGLRFTVGGWIGGSNIGVEGSAFLLERGADGASVNATAQQFAFIPIPTDAAAVSVSSNSRLWGAEINGLYHLVPGDTFDVAVIGGFRYLNLQENLNLTAGAVSGQLGVPVSAYISDRFQTYNNFYGLQPGIRASFHYGKVSADATFKLAFGWTSETSNVNGVKVAVADGAVTSLRGGIYAQPTNIGRRTSDEFAVLPEFTFNVGYNFTPNFRVYVGYNFLYISEVLRPGRTIDPVVNVSQLGGTVPGAPPFRPAPQLNGTDFWAQGINFGVQYKF